MALETTGTATAPAANWTTFALDISGSGLGLVLPRELTPGTLLLATFFLDEETSFSRLPCSVVRQQFGVGAIRFQDLSPGDKLKLFSYLIKV